MSHAKTRRLFSISIFILVLLLSGYLFLQSPIFKVNRVYASGFSKVSQDDILALAGIDAGQNIFAVDTKLARKALSVHPMIKEAQVIRHLPNQLEIKVVERTVWALIPYQNIILCVDDEGVCIDRVSGFAIQDYPILTLETPPDRVNLGQAVYPAAVQQVKKICDALGEDQKKISDFYYQNSTGEFVLTTIKETQIKFGSLDRLDEKVSYVKAVLSMEEDMNKKGREVLQYVDLRFEGEPVMKTRT